MLSILIPLYNQNALPLIQNLHKQGIESGIAFEIICFDDGSKSALNKVNEEINSLRNACFEELEHNVGLSGNRNFLAQKARYKHLLFIDGDSAIPTTNFIKNYLHHLPISGIIYGGRVHPEECPSTTQRFRWSYGKHKEDKTAAERLKSPYQSLIFNNTLIDKDSFKIIKFDASINTYGHEDTMFAYNAKKRNIKVLHIANPVIHNEIDENAIFLKKMHSSVQNLHTLYYKELIPPDFVKLLRYYKRIKRLGLHYLCGWTYILFKKTIHRNLTSQRPSLLFFDFFKIGYLCSLKTKK